MSTISLSYRKQNRKDSFVGVVVAKRSGTNSPFAQLSYPTNNAIFSRAVDIVLNNGGRLKRDRMGDRPGYVA